MVVTSTVPHFIPLPPTVNRYRPINGQTGRDMARSTLDLSLTLRTAHHAALSFYCQS